MIPLLDHANEPKEVISYCLWFVPPEPHYTRISDQIVTLSKLNGNSPIFIPHVTIVGNIKIFISSRDGIVEENAILEELESAFQNRGIGNGDGSSNGDGDVVGVPCIFNRKRGFVTSYNNINDDTNKQIVWNQACVGVIERDETLLKAIEIVKKCLMESRNAYISIAEENRYKLLPSRGFAPPLNEPHMSFIYKKSCIKVLEEDDDKKKNNILQVPEDFMMTKIVLVKTNPCTFENISNWKVVGSIDLKSK